MDGHADHDTQPRRAMAGGWSTSGAKAKVVTLIFIHTGLLVTFVGKKNPWARHARKLPLKASFWLFPCLASGFWLSPSDIPSGRVAGGPS